MLKIKQCENENDLFIFKIECSNCGKVIVEYKGNGPTIYGQELSVSCLKCKAGFTCKAD